MTFQWSWLIPADHTEKKNRYLTIMFERTVLKKKLSKNVFIKKRVELYHHYYYTFAFKFLIFNSIFGK